MSYHVTNSSHVLDHFLRMLRSLRYMCCVACCWKLRLTLAVRVLEGAGRAAASCRRLADPAFQNTVTDNIRSYIQRTWGEALADRIVSRYFVCYRIVSIVFPYGCIVPSLLMRMSGECLHRRPSLSQRASSAGYSCSSVWQRSWSGGV